MKNEKATALIDFIAASPTAFHAVHNIANELDASGFTRLEEGAVWSLEYGKGYYVTRNLSSIIAFRLPAAGFGSYRIVASHSDSPTFKLKTNFELDVRGKYTQLNTERYGGMIISTWFDRPLSVAGRIITSDETGIRTHLVDLGRDALVIPNVAIHMNRDINDGFKYNAQVDTLPLFGDGAAKGRLMKELADGAGVDAKDITGYDLFLYNRMRGTTFGPENEFICCPQLDDLECAFTSLKAFVAAENPQSACVYYVSDNEEVGSGTKQGADSTFLSDVLERINISLGRTREQYFAAVASSLMLSADNAHAVHPNHPEKTDATNCVFMNEGIVIKHNANQKYTTDAVSAAMFQRICRSAGVPCQHFSNRSDMAGGSTLGNISNAHVSLNTIDIGLAQLAMHSCYETAGVKDIGYMTDGIRAFFESALTADADGTYLDK